MYFMIDNYDSFVYNLYAYMLENGQEIVVRRADAISIGEIRELKPEGIIISPGPKRPEDALESQRIVDEFAGEIPILGVCLGHQVIAHCYGAKVCKGNIPRHGKTSLITHAGDGVYAGLPERYRVTRYHSLVVSKENLPDELAVTANSEDGVIMGIQHKSLPLFGVQYHPEAVLTEYGHEILANFHEICQQWKKQGVCA